MGKSSKKVSGKKALSKKASAKKALSKKASAKKASSEKRTGREHPQPVDVPVPAEVTSGEAPEVAEEPGEALVEPTVVDFWFDPQCPSAWVTSRWLLEVAAVRPVETHFHVMSLSVMHEHHDVPEDFRRRLDQGWAVVRVALSVGQNYGPEQLSTFYTALGTRIHLQHEGLGRETVVAALADVGLPPELIAAGDTGDNDDALRTAHWDAMHRVGLEVGSPVLSIEGAAFAGPVMSAHPHGEEAGRLFDHVLGLVTEPGFLELRRGRRADPALD